MYNHTCPSEIKCNLCFHTSQFPNGRGHLPRSHLLLKKKKQTIYLSVCQHLQIVKFYTHKWPKNLLQIREYGYDFTSHHFYSQAVFTVWRDVGEGDLHEALQGEKRQTGVDNQPQELTCFIF